MDDPFLHLAVLFLRQHHLVPGYGLDLPPMEPISDLQNCAFAPSSTGLQDNHRLAVRVIQDPRYAHPLLLWRRFGATGPPRR
jgi:hypothetical protein